MKEFHSRFINCLEDHNINLAKMNNSGTSSGQNNSQSNVTKIYPRRTNSITIIENNPDYETEKTQDNKLVNSSAGLFKIMTASRKYSGPTNMGNVSSFSTVNNSSYSNQIKQTKSNFLTNKRNRNLNQINTDFYYDQIHADANYKIEKKD